MMYIEVLTIRQNATPSADTLTPELEAWLAYLARIELVLLACVYILRADRARNEGSSPTATRCSYTRERMIYIYPRPSDIRRGFCDRQRTHPYRPASPTFEAAVAPTHSSADLPRLAEPSPASSVHLEAYYHILKVAALYYYYRTSAAALEHDVATSVA